jgi:CHRD domain-containing protein
MNTQLVVSFTALAVLYYIIQPLGATFQSESNLLQQQQNHSFFAILSGNNNVPQVNTTATGISKFYANAAKYDNELYYEINLTNIHNDVVRVDVHIGKKTENGPTVTTLYQSTLSLPSEICCRSAASESERSKFFFNGTISTQNLELGPLAGSKDIADLVRLFDSGNAYVQVYTYNPKSLSLLGGDSEIRGQIMPLPSNYTTITKLQK